MTQLGYDYKGSLKDALGLRVTSSSSVPPCGLRSGRRIGLAALGGIVWRRIMRHGYQPRTQSEGRPTPPTMGTGVIPPRPPSGGPTETRPDGRGWGVEAPAPAQRFALFGGINRTSTNYHPSCEDLIGTFPTSDTAMAAGRGQDLHGRTYRWWSLMDMDHKAIVAVWKDWD